MPKPIPVASPADGRRRRRSTTADPLKKVTIRLHETVATAIRELVASGGATSADAFVEAAVVAELRERRKQRMYAAYEEAAADSVFMTEMERTNRAFDAAVDDGLSGQER